MYGSNGVMTVVDIRDEEIGDATRSYYVLETTSGYKGSLIFVPVDNEMLVGAMRPLLSRDEILRLIDNMDSIPEAEWISDNRLRAESFKRVLESGVREDVVSVIKAIVASGVRRGEEGKKIFLSDETAMRKAEHVLYSEFACVLGIAEDAVGEFIASRREKPGCV